MPKHARHKRFTRPVVSILTLMMLCSLIPSGFGAEDGNRLRYLDESDPYYVHRDFPKLTTPMWVGEEGVEAVVVLSIDDMSDPAKYEAYLRPILDRLKQIDGRAPATIFACNPDPADPVIQDLLADGCSVEVHTIAHPCPLMNEQGFEWASDTVHDCTTLLNQIPNNKPVAYRMPCCDSRNTPTPRFYDGIFDKVAKDGNFLSIDSSVFNITTPNDPSLPRELVLDPDGQERFRKYLPFKNFVNTIEDYPYPYIINNVCWEFPATVPSDWEAQNLNGVNAPKSVADMKAAIDATVLKQGVYTLVFHPHGWIENTQVVELIDHIVATHGTKVKFLNFAEIQGRMNSNLLAGQALRDGNGMDNGVRLLDLNEDGFQDVVIGNGVVQQTRIWDNPSKKWLDQDLPFSIVNKDGNDTGVRFVPDLDPRGSVVAVSANFDESVAFAYAQNGWSPLADLAEAMAADLHDGAHFRDVNGDGKPELVDGKSGVQQWSGQFESLGFTYPLEVLGAWHAEFPPFARFVDLDEDGDLDIVMANGEVSGAYLFESMTDGWGENILPEGKTLPAITIDGKNNGVFFHSRHMWLVNETTSKLEDWAEPHSFNKILGTTPASSLNPKQAMNSFHVRPGYQVELVVSEPLVMDPVAIEWGADGALWVMEMRDYPRGFDEVENQPGSRVKILRDTDGDGQYDQSTIFLDGLSFATGLHPWRDGILVTAAPHIIFAKDTDGDDKADFQEVLYEGFGEGNQQHRVNGLRWGLDNWIHGANGDSSGMIHALKSDAEMSMRGRDLRIQPDTGGLEALAGQTQYGRSRDNWGNWFGCSNSNQGFHYVLEDRYTRRNPHIPLPDARKTLVGDRSNYPTGRVLARFNEHHEANKFTSVCGIEVYRDTLLGDTFWHNTFVGEPVHNLVSRLQLTPNTFTFDGTRPPGGESSEFLSSTDNWFRPVMLRNGPDGALWVVDMYRETIEHPEYISELDQAATDFTQGNTMGRIYRVFPADKSPRPFRRLDTLDGADLAGALMDPNPWVRDTAQRLLFERQDNTAIPALEALVNSPTNPLARLHALYALDGMKALNPDLIMACLTEETTPELKKHAIRLSEAFINQSAPIAEAILAAATDADLQVRLQVAYTLGELDGPDAPKALSSLLEAHLTDRYLAAAVFSSLQEEDLPAMAPVLATYVAHPTINDEYAQRAVAMVTRMAELSGQFDFLSEFGRTVTVPKKGTPGSRNYAAALAMIRTANAETSAQYLLGDQGILAPLTTSARTVVQDKEQADDLRLIALALLGREEAHYAEDLAILAKLTDPREPLALSQGAVDALIRTGGTPALEGLLLHWDTYTNDLRGTILNALLGAGDGANIVVTHLETGDMTARQLDAAQRQNLLTHPDDAIRARVEVVMAGLVDKDRAAVVDRFRAAAQLTGSMEKGRVIHEERCATCHKVGDMGFVVGPDLAAAGSGSFETLITSILDPNRAVEGRYTAYTVETTNLETFTGVLATESANSITLTNAGGIENTVLRSEIETMVAGDMSIMPQGLEEGLSVQDLADLVAFIRGKDRAPKTFVGNSPTLVKPDEAGTLNLLATNAEIYGDTLVYEEDYKNLGFWGSANDHAVWRIDTESGGTYDVVLEFCCDNTSTGNVYRMEVGQNLLTGVVQGTGTWDRYFTRKIGEINLEPGEQRVVFRPDGPLKSKYLIDLRGLQLVPKN